MVKLTKWDSSKYLDSEEAIAEYLKAAFEDNDIHHITRALSNVAKARNMTELAKKMGVSRTGLYKTLSENGNPEFTTVLKLINALGLQITISNPKEQNLSVHYETSLKKT
ncbi:MAG: putative addiction module antidote protein [Spirochaetes bacterium]|nr:putative addiction module antidote protein [Spirochaetota bacterium]